MNILLLGSGGREHALAWKLRRSNRLSHLYIAPGNAGTACLGTNLPFSATDFGSIRKAVLDNHIDMVVVGPEDPLVLGIHDFFLADRQLRTVPVIGPNKDAARLEGSKDFAKQFMVRHGIPTARYKTFDRTTIREGVAFLQTLKGPWVLKADGLAAGKGVLICPTLEEAVREFRGILEEERFGSASTRVVIEEYLPGIELSVFILTDGKNYVILPEAKDYKRIGEGDTGPNTGGMGSVSPVPFATPAFMETVDRQVIRPTVEGLKKENIDYRGFIFFGLMKVGDTPYVIEYNCRLGDPETESVLPRLKNDLVSLLEATASQELDTVTIRFDHRFAATVMLVSEGYPGSYVKGKPMTGFRRDPRQMLFHAGTTPDALTGRTLTSGGRVLAVTSMGRTLNEALKRSYDKAARIRFDGKKFRSDIGFDLKP